MTSNRTTTNHEEQIDRFEPQRYFYLNCGLSPRKMNELEELGVIESMPRTNPKGTKLYPVNTTWNRIMAYTHKQARRQEREAPIAEQKSPDGKFKLKRRKKDV